MVFNNELDFEDALITTLFTHYGWERDILTNPTEQDLIDNWARILFANNRERDRLNNCPLTSSEMRQIIEQITTLRTPLKLNGFINGKTVSVKRDNPDDKEHIGKEVSLKIYDRREIAAGQSRYQIVRQPHFSSKSPMLNNRRGDVMLLINGMPVIHIELKRSGIPVSQAANQIEKYSRESIFTGLFSLIQIFVAMEPNETLYFANPGPDGTFNPDFYFHWADYNNEPINDWKILADKLLSIPMAHQLVGWYTVPDNSDGVLKVMRSYQYQAANAISDRVAKTKWEGNNQLGGYVWHTTGSGKTMTSFKSAQLIANSKDADKVVFLVDRIELGTQSLAEYRGFAEANDEIQATENTGALIAKLKSADPANTLIVTSIQKMSGIQDEEGMNADDIAKIAEKRIVFIVDECHRSTMGGTDTRAGMLTRIKHSFPGAMFFGFTGTPIHEENQKKDNTTTTVFGNELHRYSIADGIRDKNVLGFDPYKVLTFADRDVRKRVALHKAKARDEAEAIADPVKSRVYYRYMDSAQAPITKIEEELPNSQYETDAHRNMVVRDILENWLTLSRGGKFHALFATSSIPDAIDYYRRIKQEKPELKITALFDPNIDNGDGAPAQFKQDGLVEIMEEYNARFGRTYTLPDHALFKKDIAARLAHKKAHRHIEREPEKQIDLLIVVDQMLTGFDSKWINTLYMDKMLEYEHIIQAFSRTNRLFGSDKPFGTIRYYRRPHTMQRSIEEAVRLYSGDKPLGLFVSRLPENLEAMNTIFSEIQSLFEDAGVPDFQKNPDDEAYCKKFASLFKSLSDTIEAAQLQGFRWEQSEYDFKDEGEEIPSVTLAFDKDAYLVLALRYKELFAGVAVANGGGEAPFEIDGRLTEIDTGRIDADYMNARFEKYLKVLAGASRSEIKQALAELHKTFARLTQDEQKYANIFLHDVERGDVTPEAEKTLRDYITEYQERAQSDRIHRMAEAFGLDEALLREMTTLRLTKDNLNEYGRFARLQGTVDKAKARAFLERKQGANLSPKDVHMQVDCFLKRFLLESGFDI